MNAIPNWRDNVTYQARTKKEFEDMESAMELLLKNYRVLTTRSNTLIKRGINEGVDISGSIEGVVTIPNSEGRITEANKNLVRVQIGDRGYMIHLSED